MAGAALLSAGAYTARTALAGPRSYLPFALVPLAFGLQQTLEGFVWLALQGADPAAARGPALGFLFFSHFLWLFWVPFCAWSVETDPARRPWFRAATLAGLIFGASLYLPFVLRGWFHAEILQHSIHYGATLIYDGILPRPVVDGFYGTLIVMPLLASSEARVRTFGLLIAVSAVLSLFIFLYALTSVWCAFAAWLSLYIVYLVRRAPIPSLLGSDTSHQSHLAA